MIREEDERKVHDYLDGRLSEAERSRFEERLSREPGLAETIEAYRALGRSLRDLPAELPPGFHARARARFERRRPASAPRAAWLSWETAGLAAAALLLLAIFVPPMLRNDPSLPDLAVPPREEVVERKEPAAKPPAPVVAEPPAPARTEGAALLKDEAQAVERERPAEEPAAALDEDFAPAPARAGKRGIAPRSAGYEKAAVTVSLALPEGLVAPGEVRVVDAEALESLETADRGPILALGADPRNERVVLIGKRSRPFDCDRIEVRVTDEVLLILHPSARGDAPPRACGVVVPRQPGSVRIVEAGS